MSQKYVVFHIDGGVGKNILATAVCFSIKNAYPDRDIVVVTSYPEVFLHNPLIFRVYKTGNFAYFYEDYIRDKDSIIMRLDPYHCEDFLYQRKHLIEIWCDLFKIPCINLQPRIFLTQRELMASSNVVDNKEGKILTIQSSGGAENNNSYSWARDLPHNFVQHLVNTLHKDFNKVLHIRRENQTALENTIQVTDNLRNLFCYVYLSDKIIAIDSMVHHIAAALGKSAAVAWIGNSPLVFGHQIHKNILPKLPKSFRHSIDSYLEEVDWTGRRYYECPFDDLDNLFDEREFLEYIKS